MVAECSTFRGARKVEVVVKVLEEKVRLLEETVRMRSAKVKLKEKE